MKFETRAIHAGMQIDEATGAVAPPLHLSTTFERTIEGEESRGYGYIREHNPTQTRLEDALAAIDSAEAALAFASGMAAGAALLQAMPRGTHVILPNDSYYTFRILAGDLFERWGLTWETVAMEDLDAVRAAIGRGGSSVPRVPRGSSGEASDSTEEPRNAEEPWNCLLWSETPSNPLLKVVDLAALASMAREHGALFVVDGTFATPALQRPVEIGADVVLHATTKYLGGHSDVAGGSLAFARKDELFDRVLHVRTTVGGIASPFNSWLVLRGIRSLAARMRVHCENAQRVAEALAAHERVEAVYYPGLPSHARHEVAKRQMQGGFGGMLSFLVRGGRAEALAVAAKTKLFVRATSLGGVESLIEHRASSEGPATRTPENLLRLSVGLENADDLVEDLLAALG